MGTDAGMELRAAVAVRRIIQKVRVANPETYDTLEMEVLDALGEQSEALGTMFEKVQDETEKGLDLARKRIERIQEQRTKDEEKHKRPFEIITELEKLVEDFENSPAMSQLTLCSKAVLAPSDEDEETDLPTLMKEVSAELVGFTTTCTSFLQQNQAEMRIAGLPADVQLRWTGLVQKVHTAKAEAQAKATKATHAVAMTKARATKAAAEAAALERKERLAELMPMMREKLKDCGQPVEEAEEAMQAAEKKAEPFARVNILAPEDEMRALADEIDEMLREARAAIESAQEAIGPVDEDVDEALRAALQAAMRSELKQPELRLGRLGRRCSRVTQLVKNFRKDVDKMKNVEIFNDLKADVLEKAKETIETLAATDTAIKEGETQVGQFAKYRKMSQSEMTDYAKESDDVVDAAKEAMAAVKLGLEPIDDDVDEDVAKKLRSFLAADSDIKKAKVQLGMMERRCTRVVNLLAQFWKEVNSKLDKELCKARESLLVLARLKMKARSVSAEQLYDELDPASAGTITQDQFAELFSQSEEGGPADLPTTDEVAAIFKQATKGAEDMTQAAFVRLISVRMKVVKRTTLTDNLNIVKGKVLRHLEVGEFLQVLEGPVGEGAVAVKRIRAASEKDKLEGWCTIAGNAGSVFLEEA